MSPSSISVVTPLLKAIAFSVLLFVDVSHAESDFKSSEDRFRVPIDDNFSSNVQELLSPVSTFDMYVFVKDERVVKEPRNDPGKKLAAFFLAVEFKNIGFQKCQQYVRHPTKVKMVELPQLNDLYFEKRPGDMVRTSSAERALALYYTRLPDPSAIKLLEPGIRRERPVVYSNYDKVFPADGEAIVFCVEQLNGHSVSRFQEAVSESIKENSPTVFDGPIFSDLKKQVESLSIENLRLIDENKAVRAEIQSLSVQLRNIAARTKKLENK
jgi:hypothetical protein